MPFFNREDKGRGLWRFILEAFLSGAAGGGCRPRLARQAGAVSDLLFQAAARQPSHVNFPVQWGKKKVATFLSSMIDSDETISS